MSLNKRDEYMKDFRVKEKVEEIRSVKTIAEKSEIMTALFHEDWELYWKVYEILDYWEW